MEEGRRRTVLGVPERLLPEAQRRVRPERGWGRTLGCCAFPGEAGRPGLGGRSRLGQRGGGGGSCLPPPQGLVSLLGPLVASLRPSSPPPKWGWWEGSPRGLSQEKVGNGKPCAPETSDVGL